MNDHAKDLMDYDNRERVDNLSQKVALLKNYAIDIEEETKVHNRFLDQVDDDFESNFIFLKSTRNRLNRLVRTNKSPKFTCYLALFMCLFLFILYFAISSRVGN